MVSFNDFSAWLTIEGVDAQEYDVQVDQEKHTVTCWVASEAGRTYNVSLKTSRTDTVNALLRIDGAAINGRTIRSNSTTKSATFNGFRATSTAIHPFRFSRVAITDDHDLGTSDNAKLGDIELIIQRATIVGHKDWTPMAVPADRTFHETTKKGFNHSTSFSQSKSTEVTRAAIVKTHGEPLAVFTFKYRPLGILQASGIAPRPTPQPRSPPPPARPSPHPRASSSISNKRPAPADFDGEDVKPMIVEDDEDERRLRELQKEMDAIQARQQGMSTHKKIKVEAAEPYEPLKGVTIDLTLDDD
ncbi:hypothetical protein Moror_3935 [Moniliophthora roreri MCA 2997]|uniref:DUF7918 domain-containing protein n=1 Tax=Moniliophthora roreri (strain MCA 2997) TaxID=1381753 RepID=V2X803_MONRO|nr:hypothetical protein Moror_3935 [Moniliophthora roreri MCA 2997]